MGDVLTSKKYWILEKQSTHTEMYKCPECKSLFQVFKGWIGNYFYCPNCAERLSVSNGGKL